MRRNFGVFAALALLWGCAAPPAPTPVVVAPTIPPGWIEVVSTPVPLNPDDPAQTHIGDFYYAGGVALSSSTSGRLHGLSSLTILPDGRILSVSDDGDLFEARLKLDEQDRLVGLSDGKLEPLTGLDGKPIPRALSDALKADSDAEGMAVLANGDRLVSFERNHRIWLYPAAGGPPRPAPSPQTIFPTNEGMEALAAYPAAGPDAYLVGGEEGEVWLCRLSTACEAAPPQTPGDPAFGLVAFTAFDGKAVAMLQRAWDKERGNRLIVTILGDPLSRGRFPPVLGRFTLQAPLTRDNFEGMAVVRNRAGGARLYLISDDNFSDRQRTLLLAFDWRPSPAPAPVPLKPKSKAKRRR